MNTSQTSEPAEPSWLPIFLSQVASLRYGVVQVVVHDSRVIQIERTEKLRFEKPAQPAPPSARNQLSPERQP